MSAPPDTQPLWLTLGKPVNGAVALKLSPLPPAPNADCSAAIVVRGMIPHGWPVTIELTLATANTLTARVGAKI